MADCLVLGADGFIGSHITDALAATGHRVRAFSRYKDGRPINAPAEDPAVEIYRGEFLNRADLDAALDGIEYVFHFVSTTTPATSAADPLIDITTNIPMSVELFQLCLEHKVKRVIFPSTGGAMYGQHVTGPSKETDLAEPVSPYAIGKLAIEGYLRYLEHTRGLDYLALRLANPYGERQNLTGSQGVIPIFLHRIAQGLPLTVYGDGSMIRDYIYIGDLVRMIVHMFDRTTQHDTYNLGSGRGLAVNDLISAMERITGLRATIVHEPSRATDVHRISLDTSRYCAEFGEPALLSLEEGLTRTWNHVKHR